jgi:hypothetical protein
MIATISWCPEIWAAERLAGDLDPKLSSARTSFALGDYETKRVRSAVKAAYGEEWGHIIPTPTGTLTPGVNANGARNPDRLDQIAGSGFDHGFR